jgi:hypothetical protein
MARHDLLEIRQQCHDSSSYCWACAETTERFTAKAFFLVQCHPSPLLSPQTRPCFLHRGEARQPASCLVSGLLRRRLPGPNAAVAALARPAFCAGGAGTTRVLQWQCRPGLPPACCPGVACPVLVPPRRRWPVPHAAAPAPPRPAFCSDGAGPSRVPPWRRLAVPARPACCRECAGPVSVPQRRCRSSGLAEARVARRSKRRVALSREALSEIPSRQFSCNHFGLVVLRDRFVLEQS